MMKYSFLILLIMTLFSCNKQPQDSPNIYVYGTEQFEKEEKNLKYTRQDAINIYCKYAFEDLQKDSLSFYTFILYGDEYVFTTIPYNAKMGYCYLNGYWVNGETGEIKEEKSDKYVNILIEGYGQTIHISRDKFIKNGGSAFSKKDE